jgi:hypothetical protein
MPSRHRYLLLSGAANPVGQNNLGTIAIPGCVAFNLIPQILAFVEGILAEVVNNGDAMNQAQAHADLAPSCFSLFRG